MKIDGLESLQSFKIQNYSKQESSLETMKRRDTLKDANEVECSDYVGFCLLDPLFSTTKLWLNEEILSLSG